MDGQTITLPPGYTISRVIRGGWQLSASHSGRVPSDPVADMIAYADAGITTFDCADIYTGVEDLIGAFRQRYGGLRGHEALAKIRVHTKFVPDLDRLATIDKAYVGRIIDRSLSRLGLERLDLVQFHWWNYTAPRWLETALWLEELRRAGKIEKLGGTNFDTPHLLAMLDADVQLATMQTQYSLLDRRPETTLVRAAQDRGVKLLCYGTVAGGFLSERWLGQPEPSPPLENRSLVKYKLVIEDFGGWSLFQQLLEALHRIARRHNAGVATIASAWALEQAQVAAVIIGSRDRANLDANLAITRLHLTAADRDEITRVLAKSKPLEGDAYALERDITGRHGSIMKYNLNDKS